MDEGDEVLDETLRPLLSPLDTLSDALFLILLELLAWAAWYWIRHPVDNPALMYTVTSCVAILAVFTYWFTWLHYRNINRLYAQRVQHNQEIYQALKRLQQLEQTRPGLERGLAAAPTPAASRSDEIPIRGPLQDASRRPDLG